jgi:hypothetical protein
LYLHADSTTLFQGTKPTMVHNSTAGQVGGGIRVASRLAEAAMSRFFRVDGNTAPKSPDVSVTAVLIQVVSSNAESLVASDSREGFLQVTLNVSGLNGMLSADPSRYVVHDSSRSLIFPRPVSSERLQGEGATLKEVAISLKQPPGGCGC